MTGKRTPAGDVLKGARRQTMRLVRDVRGGFAMWAALLVPALAVLSVGATEIGSIAADKRKMQDAADAAALSGAQELALGAANGVDQRAQAYALQRLQAIAGHSTVTATAVVDEEARTLRVNVRSQRPSFFGNLLPPGGFDTNVTSMATAMGETPLCVVGLNNSGDVINIAQSSQLRAPGCLLHGNRDLSVSASARVEAAEVQLVGTKRGAGPVSPAPMTSAPRLDDPFIDRQIAFPTECTSGPDTSQTFDDGGTHYLNAGSHRGLFKVKGNTTLILRPGAHYFCSPVGAQGELRAQDTSMVRAEGSVLFFDSQSNLEFQHSASMDLYGMRTGEWAGFLVVAARNNTRAFTMSSDRIGRLEGVLYLPGTDLVVDTHRPVADQSNWTVTISRALVVKGSPTLVINVNYGRSPVPVPPGVGIIGRGTRLMN